MKYAIIGCGRIAVNHIKAALDNNWEIVALADIIPASMTSLIERFNLDKNIKQYTDYKLMLKETKPQIVSVAAESGKHASISLDALEEGAHLIIEKPIALSLADADAIIDKAKEKNLKVAACHQNRFNVAVQKMRQALEAGRFGKLSHGSIHVRWNRNRDYYAQAPWRGTWKNDGGALMNQCIHGIDLLCWMINSEPVRVYAETRRRLHDYLEAEDVGLAVISFKNGAIATIEGTTNVYPKNLEETLYLFGETGTVKLGGKSVNTVEVWDFADESSEDAAAKDFSEATVNVYGNGHTSLFADMEQAIKDDRPPYVDAKAGRDALAMVLAIYKSAATLVPVNFPIDSCSALDFCGRFK